MGSIIRAAVFGLVASAGILAAAPVPPNPGDTEVSLPAAKLLRHRQVQKALTLSAEQRIGIIDGLADLDEGYNRRVNALLKRPDATDEALGKLEAERAAATGKFFRRIAAKTLTAEQRTRLRQLDRRLRGPAAAADPAVQAALQLTAAQKKTAADLATKLREKANAYLEKFGNDDADNLKEELLKSRAEAAKTLDAALTPDQRAAWKGLLGPPVAGIDPVALWLGELEEDDQ